MARFNGATLAERRRLVKSEVLLMLAVKAGQYADEITEPEQNGCRPVAEWGHDDPWVTLMRTYGVSAHEVGKILNDLANSLEDRAIRAGYDQRWEAT